MAARSLGIPEAQHARLRVRGHPAPHRVPAGNPRDLSRFRPRRSGCGGSEWGREKLFQYPGLKEEYYLADFEPDPGVLERLGVDTRAGGGHRPAPARHLAVPPQVEPALPAGPRPARKRPAGPRGRPAPHRRSAKLREEPRPAVGRSSPNGRSRRRAWSRCRPGRLGRRNDEPRGGGPGHPGLHHLRRQARRRRRGADPLRTPPPADRPQGAGAAQAKRRRRSGRAPRPGAARRPYPWHGRRPEAHRTAMLVNGRPDATRWPVRLSRRRVDRLAAGAPDRDGWRDG